jgi:hypothetical protein
MGMWSSQAEAEGELLEMEESRTAADEGTIYRVCAVVPVEDGQQ